VAIPKETIDLVRNTIRIEKLIGRYVPSLKPRGNNYVGLCPFHSEKTPSFVVSPDKKIFHCFGCHAGGNVFSFIQRIENVNFPKSVEIAADFAGIRITQENSSKDSETDYLYRINDFAARIFHQQLLEKSVDALRYIKERGVSNESIHAFQLGYAPESWDFLKNQINARKISYEKAVEAGVLSKKKETGRIFDTFRNRIIFPIKTISGKIAGFGGRIIGDDQPKYLNTPETVLFAKRDLLYGADSALEEIRKMGRAIVVEGYLDVIGLHQSGLKNCVAPLGTALTEKQLLLLSRYTSEIILLFDSDAAGEKASLRTLTFADKINAQIKISRLPEGDPFEFIQRYGERKLLALIDEALSPLEYQLIQSAKQSHDASMKRKVFTMFTIIEKELTLMSEREEACASVAKILGLDKNSVKLDFEKFMQNRGKKKNQNSEGVKNFDSYIDKSIMELIVLLFHNPTLIDKAMIDFAEFKPSNNILRQILKKLFDTYENDSEVTTEKLFDFFNTDDEKRFLNEYITTDYQIDNPDSSYTEIYVNVKIHEIDDKISYYTNLLRKSSAGDNSRYLAEIDIWRREKEKLTTYLYSKKSSRQL
jgi:DNA primase